MYKFNEYISRKLNLKRQLGSGVNYIFLKTLLVPNLNLHHSNIEYSMCPVSDTQFSFNTLDQWLNLYHYESDLGNIALYQGHTDFLAGAKHCGSGKSNENVNKAFKNDNLSWYQIDTSSIVSACVLSSPNTHQNVYTFIYYIFGRTYI